MNAGIIAGQMLVLFFMMLAGFIAFKAHIVSQAGSKSLSSVIINIFNPCLIISGVLNKKITYSPRMVAENLVLVAVFFLVLIVLSRLFTKMMRLLPGEVNSYRLMMIFPNLGFMGIPLVRSLYGEEAVIFVAFYIVGYNLLVYSYGILLAMGTRDDSKNTGDRPQGKAGNGQKRKDGAQNSRTDRTGLPWKKMLNIGMGACILAILIFAFHIRVPEPAAVFVDSMGNAAVPLSMMTVGIMVAQSDLKSLVTDKKQLLFAFISLLVIPAVCIPFMRILPVDKVSYGIFILLIAMPVGSVVMLVEKEYGATDGRISAKSIALTSILSVLTIPVITYLA